jgi:thiamine-monophosphate kinase
VSDNRSLPLGPGAEFDRIRRIAERLGDRAGELGDDCALISLGGKTLAISSDLSVERVHFRREWLTPEEIGWRAAAAALSDLAAEGAQPIGLMASVGVPGNAGDGALEQLMDGVGNAAKSVGAKVLGGDLSKSEVWLVDITVLGTATRPVRRSGAVAGDSLWVTGILGGARAALRSWLAGNEPGQAARDAFAHPIPRISTGARLAEQGAHAMIDLSDGLAGDVRHLAAASGCRITVDLALLPTHPSCAEAASRDGVPVEHFAARGGEDYELLVALPASFVEADGKALSRDTGVPMTRVGSITNGSGVILSLGGKSVELGGFDQFA